MGPLCHYLPTLQNTFDVAYLQLLSWYFIEEDINKLLVQINI